MANKVFLSGKVRRDPELRFVESQTPGKSRAMAKFTLVTEESYDDRVVPDFHTITVWGPDAEIAAEKIRDGDFLTVVGRIKYRRYEDKDGSTRNATEINAAWSGIDMASKFVGSTRFSADH